MDLNLISTVLTVLVIIVGGACVLLLVSTKTLRDSRDDQEKRIKFLEEERTRDRETIASQATELGIWRTAVTGEKQLASILALLSEHHTEAQENWGKVTTTLTHLDVTLGQVAAGLGDAP